jgi:hypothetical protein
VGAGKIPGLFLYPVKILKPTGRERTWIKERLTHLHDSTCTLKINSHQALDRKVIDDLAGAISLLEADALPLIFQSIQSLPERTVCTTHEAF